MEFIIQHLDEIDEVAKAFLDQHPSNAIFAFDAEMGRGTTTFINALCKVLNVEDKTSSPTYSLVNEYASPKGNIFHMDLYRINDVEEALDAGIEEYFYSNSYCFIEWPSKIEELLPSEVVKVFINLGKDNERLITTDYNEERN